MKSNATSTKPTARKSAFRNSRSRNATPISKSDLSSHDGSVADELDGAVDHTESPAVESEASDRVLEKTGIDIGELRAAVLESELMKSETMQAITLHQPWASLIAINVKSYETRTWPTKHRGPIAIHAGMNLHKEVCEKFSLNASDLPLGAIVAYADVVDCIQMTPEFIAAQSETERACGDWAPGRYAWKLENVRAIEPVTIAGKQGLWVYSYAKAEEKRQLSAEDLWNQSTVGIGLTCAAELVPVSLMPESSVGVDRPIPLSNGTSSAPTAFSREDSLMPEDLATSKPLTLGETTLKNPLILLPPALPVNHSQLMESDLEQKTIETVSPPYYPQSTMSNPNLSLLRMLPDFSIVQSDQEATNYISLESSESFPKAGTMSNGSVLPQPILERPGVESDSLLLLSPGALSTTKGRPPGQSRLDNQLQKLWLIQEGEVVNPEFLENGYILPIGWSNPEENRTAHELSQIQTQQLPTVPNSESRLVMESTAADAQHSETLSTGELQALDSSELDILPALQNLGSFNKDELLSIAREQHQLICGIERKEFELAIEKLHRVRATGICLQEFKRRCKYGEFEDELKAADISVRSSQQYMVIAKNWDIVEAKTKLVSLLAEENPTIGLKWALEAVRDQKKQLKSALPPADPDCWRTPNTKEQPIVRLITEALGGEIWCDPCADVGHHIPARVHYHSSDNGLAARNLWRKTVFINPPFSNPLEWVDKCCDSITRGDCNQAIMLLKAGTLSNQGTGELINKIASGICHWRGRINFLNDNGIAVKGSDFDCVLIYFGDRFDRFQETFETFGTVSFIKNHYSSVNKRPIPVIKSVVEESRELAAAVGLSNGKSVFPDLRDSDRKLMERYDPNTVDDRPFATATVEMSSESLALDRFELAKQNCLTDYITAISGNLSDFSDEQIAFLAKIINEESAKRICGF